MTVDPEAVGLAKALDIIEVQNRQIASLQTENANLRLEVNALRAKCGMGRKYTQEPSDEKTH